MIKEAIILAGGLGTRLSGVVSDVPKPMAPVGGKPFLSYLLDYLLQFSIERVVLAVGHKYEVIEAHFGKEYNGLQLFYTIENEPLGTGGGIANALKLIEGTEFFLLNGDTFYDVDLEALDTHHELSGADITLSLKAMENFDRYGSVEIKGSRILAFNEKKALEEGYINGGVYVVNKAVIEELELPKKFSFEKDVLDAKVSALNMQAYHCDGYFIDIGIPEDYEKAQMELPRLSQS